MSRAQCATCARHWGWSQRDLGDRTNLAQSTISRIERALLADLTFATAATIFDALGVRAALDLRAPFIADRGRQRDAGHARCVAYVARRLRRLGWTTLTEVELLNGNSHGWIDILAFRPGDETLLVIEVKTELADTGQTLRQLTWYERGAIDAARRQGWLPRRSLGVLLVLATQAAIDRIGANRELLRQSFPSSAKELGSLVAVEGRSPVSNRAIALVDPFNRSKRWLMDTPLSGRVRLARYADYAAFMSRVRRG
ncbi:MAG: helix-turn-helix transcriptional regulator [Chloroflexota bacterium]